MQMKIVHLVSAHFGDTQEVTSDAEQNEAKKI